MIRCILPAGLAVGLVLAGPSLQAQAGAPAVRDLQFEVRLDDERIGYHRFRLDRHGDELVVESEASFDVRVLFVPVYRYRHQNTEIWRDGCLASIRSQTDANGERYRVHGERASHTFRLQAEGQVREYRSDCAMTFAYWNRDFLDQRGLINAQTGELMAVEVVPLGDSAMELGGTAIAVEGYRLVNREQEVDIRVWYAKADGRWLALESDLANGKRMRYLPFTTERIASSADAGGK